MVYKWAYCLNEDKLKNFARYIKKVPGLLEYLEWNDDDDLGRLLTEYKKLLAQTGADTPGVRSIIDSLCAKYSLYQKKYADSQFPDGKKRFDINKVLTWNPRPQWALDMTVEEIDYLDHFIWQVEGLPKFLYDDLKATNLYDKICQYQLSLNATGQNNPDKNFTLETIKERFYRIMNDHKDAIHYVNHSHQIDDHIAIEHFLTEANESFYKKDLTEKDCSAFLDNYKATTNPYIINEIFCKLFKANMIDYAFSFANQAFEHIFSSPNLFWNNSEAIYGSANILYTIVEAMDERGMSSIYSSNSRLTRVFLFSLYHLLSRVIYWHDRETDAKVYYNSEVRPIAIQHKIRAYGLRANLIKDYSDIILAGIHDCDARFMTLADLNSAHYMAYSNNILGMNSVYSRDAIKLFHTRELYKIGNIDQLANKGFKMNDSLATLVHEKYKKGELALAKTETNELSESIKTYLNLLNNISIRKEEPVPYLKKDHISPSYKTCRNEIIQYLIDNGVNCFYHFTDEDKLESIIRHGGLMSYKRCLDEAIVMPLREDMAQSRDLDAQWGLEDYARLSFCKRLPKIDERKKIGKSLILLKISIEVATFEDTVFADMEATSPKMKHGTTFEDLKRINISATQKVNSWMSEDEYLQMQAEILVKGIIPLKYILNVKNPEIIES